MIVPEFKLKQDEQFLSIFIRVPYIKVSACEFYIEASSFKFYLKPYLLSLCFEQRLKEAEEPAKAVYYHDKYILEVHLEKETPGEVFNNLDLLSNVVNRKKQKKNSKVSIEVIGGTEDSPAEGEEPPKLEFSEYNYGFGQRYSKVFDHLEEEVLELFAFNPKDTPLSHRFPLSRDIIANEFDIDSYLFDKYENEDEVVSVLKDKSFAEYLDQLHERENGPEISSEEFKLKMKIGKKQLLIAPTAEPAIRKEIVSILFSYLYELVCLGGQLGPQSARTINETSLVLACNAGFGEMTMREILVDCYRRCMTYSLYKSLKKILVKYLAINYVRVILEDLRRLFEKNEPRYLLNKVYMDDYLQYVYSLGGEEFSEFREGVEACCIKEEDLGLGIEQYEREAREEEKAERDSEESEQEESREGAKKLIEEIQQLNTLD